MFRTISCYAASTSSPFALACKQALFLVGGDRLPYYLSTLLVSGGEIDSISANWAGYWWPVGLGTESPAMRETLSSASTETGRDAVRTHAEIWFGWAHAHTVHHGPDDTYGPWSVHGPRSVYGWYPLR